MEQKYNRVLMLSDVHLCHINWFGMPNEKRLEKMTEELKEEYKKNPYDMILFLGDYSLDFWGWNEGGSYLQNEPVSNTANIIRRFFSQLPVPYFMLPGNHEQYAPQTWKAITGFDRFYAVEYGNYVFLMLDNFSGNLGPTEHSDGTYTPTDVAYVRSVMAAHPGKKFFLCAHDFYFKDQETDAFRELMKDPDILMLFAGHTHQSCVIQMGSEFGSKCIARSGNYAYSHADYAQEATWGWREIQFNDDKKMIRTRYLMPPATYKTNKGATTVSHDWLHSDEIELFYE